MTKRFYSGARTGGGKLGQAAMMKRMEMEKGGKLAMSSKDRYKRIMESKLEEKKQQGGATKSVQFNLSGSRVDNVEVSERSKSAMRQMKMYKALKEQQRLRKMVVIKSKTYAEGRIDKKGRVYDRGNNLTLKVDIKDGKIKTGTGWLIGKYSAKHQARTDALIRDALKKHGVYFIQQKKLQMLAEQERLAQLDEQNRLAMGGAHGSIWGNASEQYLEEFYSKNIHGPAPKEAAGRGSNVTGWGAVSNNVWGVQADNVWGTAVDNVWGGTDSNVWGGVGGSAWSTGGGGVWSGRSATRVGSPLTKLSMAVAGMLAKPLGLLFSGIMSKRALRMPTAKQGVQRHKARMRAR